MTVVGPSYLEPKMVTRHSRTRRKTGPDGPADPTARPGADKARKNPGADPISPVRMRADLQVFKHVAEQAAEGIAVTDNEMRLVYVNEAFARLYGYSPDRMIGRNPLEFGALSSTGALSLEIDRELNKHGVWSGEITIERPDGSSAQALVSAATITDEAGAGLGRAALLTDVSELKAVEARLLEVNAALDAYAQTVSHDLKSPLACALLANEMMRDALASGDPRELSEEVRVSTITVTREIQKAYALINDLLTLAESGQEKIEAEDVDVADVVAQVLLEHERDISDRTITVMADEDLGRIRAGRTHVYQLFSNLIANGIRHNDAERPTLQVRYLGLKEDGCHGYLVCDNSSGISDDEIACIFKPARKGPTGTSKGMGLAIVKKIVDVYGGSLRIYNDCGACFDFDIRDVPE
jgi:PAS domain S-box-containing protein